MWKILMSNLGYARGLNGSLGHHLRYAHRHIYCSKSTQEKVLREFKQIILREQPDLCCLVEIDKGGFFSANLNQIEALLDPHYHFHDIANKYGSKKGFSFLPVIASKCNAFFAHRPLEFERIYLARGFKRLVYKIQLEPELTLFFAHFSLKREVRLRQFVELGELLKKLNSDAIVMGDFNILTGLEEIGPWMEEAGLVLLNDPKETTFRFHNQRKLLDLCFCSAPLKARARLRVLEQHYSDHAALMLEVN